MIKTKRLILRAWQEKDLEPFAKMNQDPRVREYFPNVMSFEETKASIDFIQQHFKKHGFGLWAVELKETGKFIGFVGLSVPSFKAHFTPCVEIGWRLARAYWDKGYATEAAKAVLHEAFTTYGLQEVVSFAAARNQRSIHVMEKIGLRHNSADDFDHPNLPKEHPLAKHVLYRLSAADLKAKDMIAIEPYNPSWSKLAEQEITKLRQSLMFPWLVGVEHFGSTAIPRLPAKPIIDIAIAVSNLNAAQALIPLLEQESYVFWADNPDKTKFFFVKGMPPFGEKRTHHIHVYLASSYDWIVRRLFRDYLIVHPEIKQAYADLKQELALKFREDREAYTEAKTLFIRSVNQKAIKPYLQFSRLTKEDLPLLQTWLHEPYVRAWWDQDMAKYKPRLALDSAVKCFIIKIDNLPIGFIQHYPSEYQKDAVGLDFFIGNSTFIKKGLGVFLLSEFIAKMFPEKTVIVDPDVNNIRAIRTYEKAGFEKVLEQDNVVWMRRKI